MNNIDVLNYGNRLLKSSNICSYNLDSELILAKVLNLTREKLLTNLDKKLDLKNFKIFKDLIYRRKKNEPLAQIFQKKEFWRYNFFINQNVLIPRPETEIIVEEVLNLTNPKSSKLLLDVGTGSGCIIISIIKQRPKCSGIAIDVSKSALKVAISNAKMHHLKNKINFFNINIDKFQLNKYDFIVSNPPYINDINLKRLETNVKLYEPKVALEAGVDGLSVIKKLIIKSRKLLKNNGKLIFEIGSGQHNVVRSLLINNGFYVNKLCKDIQSIPRVIVSTKLF